MPLLTLTNLAAILFAHTLVAMNMFVNSTQGGYLALLKSLSKLSFQDIDYTGEPDIFQEHLSLLT